MADRVGNRYFEKQFSIKIPIPSLFSIFDYRPIMLEKNIGIAMNDDFAMKFLK